MPNIVTKARAMCPELTDAVKALDTIAYTRQYSDVFSDFVDWLVFQHLLPLSDKNPIEKYTEKEQAHFLKALQVIQNEVRNRVNIWLADGEGSKYKPDNWYDPLGQIYECITSKYKSSAMGQYFTPPPVVDLMVQLIKQSKEQKVEHILDPACGSGRMGLAAAAHALAHQNPCWVSMNDLDPICTKMAAVNMCLNGVVGESICMNGLDIEGNSFRFAYRIEPALAQFPQELWEYYRLLVLMKTKQDLKKQYVIKPIPYEQTLLKQSNEALLEAYEARQKISDKMERTKALKAVEDQIKARMKGTLFEGDSAMVAHLKLPSEQELKKKPIPSKVKKKHSPKDKPLDIQGSLF